jgi:hypothetical protein
MTFMSWSYLHFFYISCPHDFHELIVFIFLLHFKSSWLSWVDRIYISFTFHVLVTFMSWSYLYFLLYFIVLMTSMSWSYLYSLYISLSLWFSWVDRIYSYCPYDSHELIVFTLIVLMIYFNPSSSYLVALVI